jgi:endoglucanase
VTAAAPSYQPALAAGASVTIGFTANGTATAPATVKLAATACS